VADIDTTPPERSGSASSPSGWTNSDRRRDRRHHRGAAGRRQPARDRGCGDVHDAEQRLQRIALWRNPSAPASASVTRSVRSASPGTTSSSSNLVLAAGVL